MRALSFVYSLENIFEGVKQEASLFAERQFDKEGTTLFEELVFDEEYLVKFRELFFDAQSDVTFILSACMRDVPVEGVHSEIQDFSHDKDYGFNLAMPDGWNYHLAKPLDIKIRQFIICYIMYRWLETKAPEYAGIYMDRAEKVKDEIGKMLNTNSRPLRRWHGYW